MIDLTAVAHARKTHKLLGDPVRPSPATGLPRATVEALVDAARFAPFHRAAHRAREGTDPAPEPWRVTMLDAPTCRALIPRLSEMPKPPGKIANMLAVADALLMVTWTPEPTEGSARWDPTEMNMEHIAAASAFTQTLLLAATEQGIETYWSSGGCLTTPTAATMLGIDPRDVAIGAIFLFPKTAPHAEAVPGKLRNKRTAPAAWSHWTDLA